MAVRYDRCCAYFSSTVLAAAARGFAPLVERLLASDGTQPADSPIRLLVNEELSRDDVDAMLFARGADALAERLSRRLLEPRDALERERLALLGLLVKRRLLEVRVGVMRSGHGILHAKFGVITDQVGDAIVFSGSGNESASGLVANYESLEVTSSWNDPDRYNHFRNQFLTLWSGNNPQVDVISLPTAVRDRLIHYHEAVTTLPPLMPRKERLEGWMRWRFALEAPWFPDGARNCDAMAPGIRLWPHQIRVVEECAAAWPAGRLLCDEVGMGKTVEAIMILRRLMAGRGVRRALLLVPAGILKQWQGELREKGGLIVPRLEGQSTLVWPDGRLENTTDFAEALGQPILLASREMVRLEQNTSVLLEAPRWDLVLLDEAHAARRSSQVETEFNSATLLLDLLRKLQLKDRTRGLLLLSATPMQIHPWEPWDLMSVLGEGAPWLADFGVVREFYDVLADVGDRPVPRDRGHIIADIVQADPAFPALPIVSMQLPVRLLTGSRAERADLAVRLRNGAPLGRRMHRNTRQTLQSYYRQGILDRPPANRSIQDIRYDFAAPDEREVYDGVQEYVERRFKELEEERPGKGFVMTVYRRRAASSPIALQRSLERRRVGLERVVKGAAVDPVEDLEASDRQDLDELLGDVRGPRVPSSLPDNPVVARLEQRDVEALLRQLAQLKGRDSKLERFDEALRISTDDGRACLVFSEFTDTVEYLRDALFPRYGSAVACYTGDGGKVHADGRWFSVAKEEITARLANKEIRVLLCSDAASEGLNLQVASALINYDLPWNPARVEQRIGRIDRIGQMANDVRIVNLILANSVDERVYQVLGQRCDLFQTFVGPMQPVLSVARRMLLGAQPFSAAELEAEVERAKSDHLAQAAFVSHDDPPPTEIQPGVTIDDLARAYVMLRREMFLETPHGSRGIAANWSALAADTTALPLSPFIPSIRFVGNDLLSGGDLVPLVLGCAEEGPFRVVIAVWANADADVVVTGAQELEALLDMWDGSLVTADRWKRAHEVAREQATRRVDEMRAHAEQEERAALERQVDAARRRLLGELGRFLACAREKDEDFNAAFHRWMQRGGQTAALLVRAHGLVGYPEWEAGLLETKMEEADGLTTNQRKNVLLGTPLEAAVRDPRWLARESLNAGAPQ
jgi:superfamily II DNA or RNA helicase